MTETGHCSTACPPPPADLIAEARLLKLGRRLAVGDVMIYSGDGSDSTDYPVAHATLTYAIPGPG
mgnify:CR=1 FL=1